MRLSSALLWGVGYAWVDKGHMLTAAIARQHLIATGHEDIAEKVDALLRSDRFYPEHQTMERAATWMDFLRKSVPDKISEDVTLNADYQTLFNPMHYVNIPIHWDMDNDRPNPLSEAQVQTFADSLETAASITALKAAVDNLMASGAPEGKRNNVPSALLSTRILLHLMGDCHMPLHSVGMEHDAVCRKYEHTDGKLYKPCHADDETFMCSHDAGANNVRVDFLNDEHPIDFSTYPEGFEDYVRTVRPSNLHALWDSQCGELYGSYFTIDMDELYERAQGIRNSYSYEDLENSGVKLEYSDSLIYDIMNSAYEVATDFTNEFYIYKGAFELYEAPDNYVPDACHPDFHSGLTPLPDPLFVPGPEYIGWCRDVVSRLFAIGGYRLAKVLEVGIGNLDQQIFDAIAERSDGSGAASIWIAAPLMLTLSGLVV